MSIKDFVLYLLLIYIWCFNTVNCIVGYDCTHPNINITTIGLDYIPACRIEEPTKEPVTEMIQLIQITDKYPVHVKKCQLKIIRHITYCGMHSHSSEVNGGLADYNYPLTKTECLDLHQNRAIKLNGVLIVDLMANSSNTRNIILAGSVDNTGKCSGSTFSDSFGFWDNVIVQATLTIVLTDYVAEADTNKDSIVLKSGLTCTTSLGQCDDFTGGFVTWIPESLTRCDIRKHIVLFEGPAKKYLRKGSNDDTTITYMVEQEGKIFGLRIIADYIGCMFKTYTTEHPKLLIVPKTTPNFYFQQGSLYTPTLDLMAYVNTKFVFIEKVRVQNEHEMFMLLSHQRCNVERKALQTILALAVINPTEFAFTYMMKPGYTATTLGEVVHLITCIPVDVRIRSTEVCYKELPVLYNNRTMFLTPRSRLIQLKGTEIDCDPIVSSQFRIDGSWYSIGVSKHQVPEPIFLTVEPISTWKPHNIHKLATSGIYSYEEAEELRSRLMNPYEKEAINNIIVRGVSGHVFERQGISLNPLVDENMINNLGDRIKDKVWGFFKIFGNISSGLLGMYFSCKVAKFIIDTAVHCRLLYEIYGFSVTLVCCIWDSVTTYLLHKSSINATANNSQSSLVNHDESNTSRNESLTEVIMNHEITTESFPTNSCLNKDDIESIQYPRLTSEYRFRQP